MFLALAENPSRLRGLSLDLVPAGAYWRAPFPHEDKLDFAAMEVDEGRALTGSRVRMAIILGGALDKWVAWAREAVASPAKLRALPAFLGDELGDEMTRLLARAYSEGVLNYQRAMRRMGQEPVLVGLTMRAERDVRARGAAWGVAMANSLRDRLAPIFANVYAPDGRRMLDTEAVVKQIQSVFGAFIEPAEEGDWQLAEPEPQPEKSPRYRATRRMKVRDAEQHAKWQKEFVKYSPWLKREAEKQAKAARLKAQYAKTWLQTERTRYFAHGTIAASQADPNVVQLAYSAIRDDKTCESCLSRDGRVRPKGDAWWVQNTPPMHHACRCSVVPIVQSERVKSTPLATLRSEVDDENVGEGFGIYNPKRVESARRLGIQGPRTKAMTRAIRTAAGRNKR